MIRIHLRKIFLVSSLLSLAIPGFAQSEKALAVASELSLTLGKVVSIVADPDQLRLTDVETQDVAEIVLPGSPRLLTVSADGAFAAVAMDESIAYVDLKKLAVIRTYALPSAVTEIALHGPRIEMNLGEGIVRSIDLATGELSAPSISVSGIRKEIAPEPVPGTLLERDRKSSARAAGGVVRANVAPAVISATPTSPAGSPQTFVITTSDADGFANLLRIYFLFNSNTGIPQNTCHGFYDRPSNSFYLYSDNLSLLGPIVAGTNATLQNSQCQINAATSSAVGSGNNLTINMTASLLGAYANSSQNIYFWAKDLQNNDTGWIQTGTWRTNVGNQPPSIISLSPTAGVMMPTTYRVVARDPNGANNIWRIYFQIGVNSTITPNGCHGFWDRNANAFYVYRDNLASLAGPAVVASSNVASNSQCYAFGGFSRIVANSGNDLVLEISLGILPDYLSPLKNVYFWAKDDQNNDTGWVLAGTLGLNSANLPPSIRSGGPAVAVGSPQVLTVNAADQNGYDAISYVYWLVNSNTSIPQNTCHGFFHTVSNSLWLYSDSLQLMGPITPGGTGSLQNSQCRIDAATTSYTGANADLTFRLGISQLGSYLTTPQNVYFWAKDNLGNDTGWVRTGTWNPLSATVPAVVSGTPDNAFGSTLLSMKGRDPNGFADIFRLYFQIGDTSAVTTNGCHGFYDRPSNSMYLYDDQLTGLIGPLVIGSGGSIQNSQCALQGTGSSVTGSGTDVDVRVTMRLQGSYAGTTKNVYLWVKDFANNDTGWVQTGTFAQPQ